jgi:hypothetical protein
MMEPRPRTRPGFRIHAAHGERVEIVGKSPQGGITAA